MKRTQGSFIENKGSALVFQYRDADPDFGTWQAKELSNYLSELMFGYPVSVVNGKGYVEVRLRGVSKGQAVDKVLTKIHSLYGEIDFLLCIGDDRSDEDMFAMINEMCKPTDEDSTLSAIHHCGNIDTGFDHHIASHPVNIMGRQGSTPPQHVTKFNNTGSSSSESVGVSRPNRQHSAVLDSSCSINNSRVNPMYRGAEGTRCTSPYRRHSASSDDMTGGRKSMESWPYSNPPTDSTKGAVFTVTVGKKPSKAQYYLNDTEEVSELLAALKQCADFSKHSVSFTPHDTSMAAG